ncbi:hypothetical protein H4R27_004649 [Coemansia aciculifera]|nr:hypothetical protein H4R27_004649 [Coemansia aciculifera]
MPYQGKNPRYPTRGGGNSTRFSPYGRLPADHRSGEMSPAYGGYDDREYDGGGGGAGYRASRRSPSIGRYPSSRGNQGRDTGGVDGHLEGRSYNDRYDEDESEYSFSTRGRGRGRGGRGRDSSDARGRGTMRGRGAFRGRGEARGRGGRGGGRDHDGYGYGHGHGYDHGLDYDRSPEEFYGSPRAPSRFSDAGGYNHGEPGRREVYSPTIQDLNLRFAEASYEARNDMEQHPHYRQQQEHGIKRGAQNDDNMDSDGFRRPTRPFYENEPSSYANEPAPRRPISQDSTSNYQQQKSRSTGNTDRPGYYKEDIPSAPRRFNVRRTVFMRIPYQAVNVSGSIRSKLAKFGEIADKLELHSKGVCYVMFYDSRDAANAINVLKGNFYIGDNPVAIVESRHRPDAFTRSPQQTDYQATMLVSLVGAKRGFEAADRVLFEKYGEVCAFYPYLNSETEWVVEYYDSRSAKEAALNCHGQDACKGTMYTTFLWDDSVPRPVSSPAPTSKRFRPEAAYDSRAESSMSFDRAALRSANAAVFVKEPRQSDDPYRTREQEREQMPSLQTRPPPMPLNTTSSSSIRSAPMAQPPQPVSAPVSSSALSLPGTKKRPSAAKWMDSAVSSSSSRSGSMDVARGGADQVTNKTETRSGEPQRGERPPATVANDMNSALSKLAQDPTVKQQAQAVREILQQHHNLLGLVKLPTAAKTSSAPSASGPLPSMSTAVSGAPMSAASAVSALHQLVSRAPRYDSQSTMVADISPLIPSKDLAKTLSGLVDYTPSTVALNESANAAANAVRTAPRYDPTISRAASATTAQFSGIDTASSSATAVSAMMPSVSKQGYTAQQELYQNQDRRMPAPHGNENEGVNSLFGILANFQKTRGAPGGTDSKKR